MTPIELPEETAEAMGEVAVRLFEPAALPIVVLVDAAPNDDEGGEAAKQILASLSSVVRSDPTRARHARMWLVPFAATVAEASPVQPQEELPPIQPMVGSISVARALDALVALVRSHAQHAEREAFAANVVVILAHADFSPEADRAAAALGEIIPWLGNVLVVGAGTRMRREELHWLSGDVLLGAEVTAERWIEHLPLVEIGQTRPGASWYCGRKPRAAGGLVAVPSSVDFGSVLECGRARRRITVSSYEPWDASCLARDVTMERTASGIELSWPRRELPPESLLAFAAVELRSAGRVLAVPLAGRIVAVTDPVTIEAERMRGLAQGGRVMPRTPELERAAPGCCRLPPHARGSAGQCALVLGWAARGGRRTATNDWVLRVYPDPEANERARFISRQHFSIHLEDSGAILRPAHVSVDLQLDGVRVTRDEGLGTGTHIDLGIDDDAKPVLALDATVLQDACGTVASVELRRVDNGRDEEEYLLLAPPAILGAGGIRSPAARPAVDGDIVLFLQEDGIYAATVGMGDHWKVGSTEALMRLVAARADGGA